VDENLTLFDHLNRVNNNKFSLPEEHPLGNNHVNYIGKYDDILESFKFVDFFNQEEVTDKSTISKNRVQKSISNVFRTIKF